MTKRVQSGSLSVDALLWNFINDEALKDTGLDQEKFWADFEALCRELAPRNRSLVAKRDQLQEKIDTWYSERKDQEIDLDAYKQFLREIGYLLPEGDNFSVNTSNVDPEIATIAGPQLVVPITNARYVLNAANARWGSLYDALYGTDAISEDNGATRGGGYNPVRGDKVIAWARNFLDNSAPLANGSWSDVTSIVIQDGQLSVYLENGSSVGLSDPEQLVGYNGDSTSPNSVVVKRNNLHADIIVDRDHPIGAGDKAGIADVVVESAITAICDCEDSVATVDGEDKTLAYRNWLGLMKGDLEDTFVKGGKEMTRSLNADRSYKSKDGSAMTLTGRAVLLVRNVGDLMTNPAISMDGNDLPETIMDCMITSMIALHDIGPNGRNGNSRNGSVYIVKPKMHGPEEVQFACDMFTRVEQCLGMQPNTLKIGIMDEERRTTVNLKECIRIAKERVVFINTGFLDRTGDEIHTAMLAGPVLRKADMKGAAWIKAYEDWNVDIGLECGFSGRAQIGKGMWAMPDLMAEMLDQKIGHPKAGANCAWVPSPTAATLHATHYHSVSVAEIQAKLSERNRANIDDILSVPLATRPNWAPDDIQNELDNNAQGILGYMVRWVEQGVGCSKVPDINNVGLMEDRATLRISTQHIANWLEHGICSQDQVMETLKRMAKVVDEQNAGDPAYRNMAPNYESSVAFQSAVELVIEGKAQPSGYTEPVLHRKRLEFKQLNA